MPFVEEVSGEIQDTSNTQSIFLIIKRVEEFLADHFYVVGGGLGIVKRVEYVHYASQRFDTETFRIRKKGHSHQIPIY